MDVDLIKEHAQNTVKDMIKYKIFEEGSHLEFKEESMDLVAKMCKPFVHILISNTKRTLDPATALMLSVNSYCPDASALMKASIGSMIAGLTDLYQTIPSITTKEIMDSIKQDLKDRKNA
jgi:hypothetical protein